MLRRYVARNAPTLNKYIMMAFGVRCRQARMIIQSCLAPEDAIYITVNQLLCNMMFETRCATNVIGISDSKAASYE